MISNCCHAAQAKKGKSDEMLIPVLTVCLKEENSFEKLEKETQEVLNELARDKHLEKFRIEYEKLTKALKKSHENEKRLMTKCRELNAEIASNSVKINTALKLSQEDQTTINSLKQVCSLGPTAWC